MKRFKFKLDALLKLRRFEEEKIKVELGQIIQHIQDTKDEIQKLNESITITYDSQEKLVADIVDGKMLSFYPGYVSASRAAIEAKENLLYSLNKKHDEKLDELNMARGKTKVIEKLEDKAMNEYKKEKNKFEQEQLEEAERNKKKSMWV